MIPNLQLQSTRQCLCTVEASLVLWPWPATQRAMVQLLCADAASFPRRLKPSLDRPAPLTGLNPQLQHIGQCPQALQVCLVVQLWPATQRTMVLLLWADAHTSTWILVQWLLHTCAAA